MFPIMKQRDRKKEKEERGERVERERERHQISSFLLLLSVNIRVLKGQLCAP